MTNTARNFALQLGSLITLYISLTSLIVLVFGLINIVFPDAVDTYWQIESTQSSMRFAIASLIVVFPSYLLLTRLVNQTKRHDEAAAYLGLTRWLIYLSLLLGGGVLLGDLVTVIYTFLNGEITTRFILKALVLIVIIGTACFYYFKDAQGYWKKHERQSIYFAGGTSIVVITALILGFMNIATPESVREMRLDEQQIRDLQDMQWRIEEYYRLQNELPLSIDIMYEGISMPQPPENRPMYEYNITNAMSYDLCATFSNASQASEFSRAVPMMMERNYKWTHGEGRWCFKRVIQPTER